MPSEHLPNLSEFSVPQIELMQTTQERLMPIPDKVIKAETSPFHIDNLADSARLERLSFSPNLS